jgi:hypothetical protein
MHVELFTGARAADNTEASRSWARSIVREVLASLPSDALVIVGDAAGVDRIVRSEVMLAGLNGEEYALNGNVYAITPKRERITRWTRFDEIAPVDASDPRWRSWPLRRNEMMRDAAVRRRIVGATVHATALVVGEARGTRYTCDVCERAGIVVTRYEPGDAP